MSAAVSLHVDASDESTWLTRLRVSNKGAVNANRVLKVGWTLPIRDELEVFSDTIELVPDP